MNNLILKILLFIFLAGFSAAAQASPASSAFLSGGNAVYSGRGGAGVSDINSGISYINPASMALLERFNLSINYGSLDSAFIYPWSAMAFPTSYGVIGLGFGFFTMEDEIEPAQKGYLYSLSFAKELTSKFLFGISIDGMSSQYAENTYYTGIKPGFIYKIDGSVSAGGFGIFNPAVGLSAGIGFSSGEDSDISSVTAGYSFSPWMSRNFSVGFFNDISAIEGFGKYPVKFGLELNFKDSFFLRGGAVVPDSYEFMTYTGGAGFKLKGDTYSCSLNYALSYSEKQGVSHFAGINFEYGALDRDPPALSIVPDYTYISPNHDGVQDYLVFDIDVTDRSRITGWKLQIRDDRDMTVKEFRMSDRELEEKLTPAAFFKRLFSKKETLTVPDKILWDGTDNSGEKLPDGRYKYYFYAWDARDNIAPVKSGVLAIDCTSPSADIKTEALIFSPNGDKKKDTITIFQKIKTSPDDIWTAEIKNSEGTTVLSFRWDGNAVPEKFVWDGKDRDGAVLPDGLYSYSITSTDKAGNKTTAELREIVLITKMETADVRFENEYLSYKKNDQPFMKIFPDLSSMKGLESWEVSITDSSGKKIIRTITGSGTLPAYIEWDWLDTKGKPLDDGKYSIRFSAMYSSGNNPVSFPKRLIVDSTPPDISISHSPDIFSPDGDGENDFLTLKIRASDNTGFSRWEIKIFNESGILFKKFSGEGAVPSELKWDGTGSGGELVESASDYEAQFIAVDSAGNVSETATDKIPVDILVIVTERGLKMRISNIEFSFGSSDVRKRGVKILDRVYQILEKYGSYNVVIEGHTDDVGEEEYNLKLSEKRALTVKNYLIEKGTKPERLKYVGMGESLPFYPNTNDENRRRNRRVEFLLEKDNAVK